MNSCVRALIRVLAVGLILSVGASPLAAQTAGKVRVAVLNFENNSTWYYWGDRLGLAAADELATQLVKSGQFTVIERAQLDAILAEQNLGASGAVTSETAVRLGKLLGVQLLLTGSITQFSIETQSGGFRGIGGSYSQAQSMLDVRLVNTETGEILVAEEGEGNKRFGGGFFRGAGYERDFDAGVAAEALRPAVEQVVSKLIAQADRLASLQPVAPAGQVVQTRDADIFINRGQNVGVQVGQRFDVIRVIDEIKDVDGKVLDVITDKVGVIEVTRVLSQSAICKVVEGEATQGDTVQ